MMLPRFKTELNAYRTLWAQTAAATLGQLYLAAVDEVRLAFQEHCAVGAEVLLLEHELFQKLAHLLTHDSFISVLSHKIE